MNRAIMSWAPRRFRSCRCILSIVAVVHLFIIAVILERTYMSGVDEVLIREIKPEKPYHADKVVSARAESVVKRGNRVIKPGDQRHLKSDSDKTACGYRTTSYLNDKAIVLDQSPFVDYTKHMECLEGGKIAVFADRFVLFKNVMLDPSKTKTSRKGGEKMDEVWDQPEQDEYFNLLPGYFNIPCKTIPSLTFREPDHLVHWQNALSCYKLNETDLPNYDKVSGLTIAIQRYEYVNLYHTMTDFYNAFVLMLIFGASSSRVNILFVDAHPVGTLDDVWSTLFGHYIRAGRLTNTTVFSNLVWGMLGYFSPLNIHDLDNVPYLMEFREFFLRKHNISSSHVTNCQKLNIVMIWRRDYVAHPRNKQGSVVRKFDNEMEMVDKVKAALGSSSKVIGLQLDAMPMTDQLKVIAECDILIGMHGAGLSHILFLSPTSGVIELKPNYSNPSLQHFEAMARWRKIPYSIWINGDPSNEKGTYKTYIPGEVIQKEVNYMYKRICQK